VFREDGARFAPERLRDALAETWAEVQSRAAGDRYGGVSGEAEFWRKFLGAVRSRIDGGEVSRESFGRLATHFRNPASWVVYGDVLPTLEDLRARGLALAVISNWDSHLPHLLEALRLSEFFRVVSVSAIEATGKPSPEIFLRTCARLDVAPAEALHVGDSITDDYEGARAAGLSALLIDREGRHLDAPGRIEDLGGVCARVLAP
jgi:putative hydrolase of the HAD superfamily